MNTTSHWAAVANSHAVLTRYCALNSPWRRSAARAHAKKGAAYHWAAVANAHAVLASSYGLISPKRRPVALTNAAGSATFHWSAVAKTQTLYANSYALNSPKAILPPAPTPQKIAHPSGLPSQTPTLCWQVTAR